MRKQRLREEQQWPLDPRACPCGPRAPPQTSCPRSQPGLQVQCQGSAAWPLSSLGIARLASSGTERAHRGSWLPHLLPGVTNVGRQESEGKYLYTAAELGEQLGGCCPQPGAAACHTGLPQRLPTHLVCRLPSPQTSESSILPMQALLPLTLSLTFCNHEILMTDIEFKVQFVSESFGGKGSWKGTVFKEMGWGVWDTRPGGRGSLGLQPAASSEPSGLQLLWKGDI